MGGGQVGARSRLKRNGVGNMNQQQPTAHCSEPAQRRCPGAFTLVELLVVIGIIALLIAVLLPALGRARKQAQTVACLANLRSIGQAIGIYAVNNKQSLPYGYWDGIGSPDGNDAGSSDKASDWALLLMGNALGKGGTTYGTQAGNDANRLQPMFACPSAIENPTPTTERKLHYSCHPRLMPRLDDKDLSKPATTPPTLLKPYKYGSVKRSSEVILVFDGSQILSPPPIGLGGNAYAVANNIDQDGLYRGDSQQGRSWNYLLTGKPNMSLSVAIFTPNSDWPGGGPSHADIRWRHGRNDTANFLFVDGHADSIRLKKNVNADLKLNNLYVNPQP
jgi:prepilin-type processing-associated H-X9-DG protein